MYENTQWGEREIELNTDYLELFIDPIPLTEEILYKNEFRKLSNGDWELKYIDTNYSIVYSNGAIYLATFYTLSKGYVRICECKYVHKLQHILKDLEIEKEIVL